MKIITFKVLIIAILCLSINVFGQEILPVSVWRNVSDYTFMYNPESLKKGTDFHIQTNHHFLAFNYKNLHLKDLRTLSNPLPEATAVRKNLDFLPITKDQNLLDIVLIHEGKEYKLVKGGEKPSDCRVIESGKYFQRREIINLGFEEGAPELEAALEIVSWPDRLSFVLKATSTKKIKEAKLQIRLKKPIGYERLSKIKNQLLALNKDGDGFLIYAVDKAESNVFNGTLVVSKSFSSNKNKLAVVVQSVKNNNSIITYDNEGVVKVEAHQITPKTVKLSSKFNALYGWHKIDLRNDQLDRDGIERVKLVLKNSSSIPKSIRLCFGKTKVRYITGISPILRDNNQQPTGIPVQISKNWHSRTQDKFAGPWFRGFTILTIPGNKTIELELTTAHGFWGTLPAASHSQLSLVGWSNSWGSNQLWDQSAIGAFGESICYEPDGGQAKTMVTDVRPLFIESVNSSIKKPAKWSWTPNVGGADFFRFYDEKGEKKFLKRLKTSYKRYCPNLTEVTYAGTTSEGEADYELTTSIYRSDDLVRGVYKIKLKVTDSLDFNRLSILQIGSDTYSYTGDRKFAFGDENGLIEEWNTQWGDKAYRKTGLTTSRKTPWISLHEAVNRYPDKWGAWANRGFIVRKWNAKVQGKKVKPYFSEYGTEIHKKETSIAEINLPPNVTNLLPGDYIEAEIVQMVIPQEANSYYGTNKSFKNILKKFENTWQPVFIEATENNLKLDVEKGDVISKFPIAVKVNNNNEAKVNILNGIGYVPITFTGLTSYTDHDLEIYKEGKRLKLKQEVHGNDFWQTDYNSENNTWEITYTVPLD